jgi:hypothetical protein
MNEASLTATQAAAFVLVGGLALRCPMRRGAPVIRAILAAGLAAGACMHLVDLVERGPLGSPHQPLAFNVFWTSLAALDPLGALLLITRSRAGIVLTLAIMVTDVSVNLAASDHITASANWRLWSQVAFAAFALVGAPRVWAADT